MSPIHYVDRNGNVVTSLDFGTGRLWTRAPAAILDIPPAAAGMLSPAAHCLFEWTDYWWECPGADRVRIGATWQDPIASGLFLRVRAAIVVYPGDRAVFHDGTRGHQRLTLRDLLLEGPFPTTGIGAIPMTPASNWRMADDGTT